ncbi:IS3 family transposase [Oceanivirga miroungae]|uniref:IS3 family transposase n=1 Tax=Oceanivirga miroungae TaxID=1130046 RepID=UPI001E2AFA6A|nr:IS3 family transposase [Oceanivirga miroungae]
MSKCLTIEALKHKYDIKYMCEVLELNRSTYYNFLKYNAKDEKDKELKETIKQIDKEVFSTYGRNRMTIEVNKRLNSNYNSKKIRRIMKELNIECVIRVKKKRFKKTAAEYTAENLMNRDFTVEAENQKWSTDVTEVKTAEGKIYISGIIDIHSKKLLGYSIRNTNDNELVFTNLKDVIEKENIDIDNNNLMIQTDRGYQYTSYGFKHIRGNIKHSMSRPGHCPDNSPIESFWGIFKSEFVYNPICKEYFKTKELAIKEIENYFKFYNETRITLKGTTPNIIRNNSLI